MSDQDQMTNWISKIKEGDETAAQVIWEQYFDKLVRLARKKLDGLPRRAADEEDVALSAFNSFYQRAKDGRFPKLDDRHDLWKLLVTITVRKSMAQFKHQKAQKRGGGQVRGESIFARADRQEQVGGMEQVLGKEPTPQLAAMVVETCGNMLDTLQDESLRAIAVYKMQGYSNEEIAEMLDCTTRTVERKLGRIRGKWTPEGEEAADGPLPR